MVSSQIISCLNKRPSIVALAVAALMLSCSPYAIHRLDKSKLTPKRPDAQIAVYAGTLDRPHQKLAIIDSEALADKSDDTKLKQIEQLKMAARKLGADAVEDVRLLRKKVRGLVVDDRVPFQAWKQGEHETYFLRGVAIRFVEKETPDSKAK